MKTIELLVKTLLVFAAGLTLAQASVPVAVYARVEKVVLEPNPDSPQRIQIWGVFSMAKPDSNNEYLSPARGYLYFKLAGDKEAALNEWADLKQVAGTARIVAFGSRFQVGLPGRFVSPLTGRLRKPNERPENPDPYAPSTGLIKLRGNTDYPPIRALLDYKD